MQARPSPTSPSTKAQQQAEAVSGVWKNAELQQPPRTPWGRLIMIIVVASLLLSLGSLIGVGILVHRYPNAWWTKFVPLSTTSTTVIQQRDTANGTIPSAVTSVRDNAYALALNQGKTGIYTAADTTGYAWPLSTSGWLLSLTSAWPADVKSLVVIPTLGQAQAVASTVPDPATTFVFIKTSSLQSSPLALAPADTLKSGLRVWVVTADSIVPHTLGQHQQVRWVSSDRLETSWTFDAALDVPVGTAVVDNDGRLVGLVGADQHLWPASSVSYVVKGVLQSSSADRPAAGFRALNLQEATVAGDPTATGLLVGAPAGQESVTPESAAATAGLKNGDIITTIDGQVPSGDLYTIISRYRVGETMKLEIERGTTTKTLTLKLGSLAS